MSRDVSLANASNADAESLTRDVASRARPAVGSQTLEECPPGIDVPVRTVGCDQSARVDIRLKIPNDRLAVFGFFRAGIGCCDDREPRASQPHNNPRWSRVFAERPSH